MKRSVSCPAVPPLMGWGGKMRKSLILSILAILLWLGGSPTIAQSGISLDHVSGVVGGPPAGLLCGQEIIFHMRLTNNSGGDITALTHGFQVYSPDGAEWTTTEGAWVGDTIYIIMDIAYVFPIGSSDGVGADTVGFGAVKLGPSGIPDGFDEILWTITIGPIDHDYAGKTICLDSCFFPPSNPWKWLTTQGDLIPAWDGPHCFEVTGLGPDTDLDGTIDLFDNCPYVANPNQEDADNDGRGDVCDCIAIAGNIDCDSEQIIDIADLTLLIDFLFMSKAELDCPGEGNTDGDPDDVVDIGDLTTLIDFMFISYASPAPCRTEQGSPSGSIIDHTGCKSIPLGDPVPDTSNDLSCIEWAYDGGSILTLNHVNAGFNCCPIIAADIRFDGNTIIVEELDSLENGGCDCLCLFDVEYEITNLSPGEYRILVIEPYRWEGDIELDFTIDLSTAGSGVHCESRTHYPWGQP
ncbi:MAG: thrombospondin type 3 repeat-containing protein [Candidatus Zixiibacteriota bacterium]|nr:MAG: thrombospondin type 3 repeat-containing protein [candidate division Zixibacteria bacterium]